MMRRLVAVASARKNMTRVSWLREGTFPACCLNVTAFPVTCRKSAGWTCLLLSCECDLNFIFGSHIDSTIFRGGDCTNIKNDIISFFIVFFVVVLVFTVFEMFMFMCLLCQYTLSTTQWRENASPPAAQPADDVSENDEIRNDCHRLLSFLFLWLPCRKQKSNVEGQKQFIVENQSALVLSKANKSFRTHAYFWCKAK